VELRVSERNVATMGRPEQALCALADAGARLVIDEMGRSSSSLPRLARLPLCGLQVDRALAVAAKRSSAAQRACGAIAELAKALDLQSITAGIDDAHARDTMSKAGFGHGSGDLYAAIQPATEASRRHCILAPKHAGRS
jgi:EAL domain-containing protein (putative c-di-GMP-specific phosphodiesterase class I)